jgi:hypothetical protein
VLTLIFEMAAAILLAKGAISAVQKFVGWRSRRAWQKRVRPLSPAKAPSAYRAVLELALVSLVFGAFVFAVVPRYDTATVAAGESTKLVPDSDLPDPAQLAEHLRECDSHVLPPPPPAVMSDDRGIPCN